MTELQRDPMHTPRGRWALPPPKPHVCQQCGGWPATRITGPAAADRMCETCAEQEDES